MQRYAATAAILAGGASRRMGQAKGLLSVDGQPLVSHIAAQLQDRFAETLLVADDPAPWGFAGLPVVPDRPAGAGPLGGLAGALAAARHGLVFLMACDMPEIDWDLVEGLMALPDGADCAVPRAANGYLEPLFAVYRRRLLPELDRALAGGLRKVQGLYELAATCFVPYDRPGGIRNINTPEEYAAWRDGGRD
jgi:molybdopterin-guanine dinucleotide biosynthesis protein A